MRKGHVGSVVVLDGDGRKPVGILTDRDLVVEVMAPGLDARTITAGDIMTASPAVTREDDDALWALKTMRERGVSMDDLMERFGSALGDVVQALGTERAVESKRRA